ncbi:hypothetical protein M23134_02687 [Microscilla marina ATCC 23134]|uniref:Uncharacterized protein n=2 Tax=Microscilla marina TaxID=1027 RepID=A1ZNX9_MICM2|nr:hypothetical protein M23134_02687 [Microscilla marina ATCC 23134]
MAKAQNYTTFKFIAEKDNKVLTIRNSNLNKEAKQVHQSQLAQLFIMKKLDNYNVLIAFAQNPDLFLKRNNDGSLSLTKIPGNDPKPMDFQWTILYAGFPYLVIARASDPSRAIRYDQAQGRFRLDALPQLPNNRSKIAADFRFKIERVLNTF